jgi:NAD(P)-dependent dehydrogenase (short-subunit alcohol dehydrogenase family)
MRYKEKVVLITGAASGIGKAASFAFAKEGAHIIAVDVNVKAGEETVEQMNAMGCKGTFIRTDVSNHQEVCDLVKRIADSFGKLDVAINNAGIGGAYARTKDYPVEDWERTMTVNASSVFYCMREEIPLMLSHGGGVILNTASIAGLRGLPNSIAYTASKHAVVGMTKTSAMEYARHNIRINALCPVFTVTPLFDPVAIDTMAKGIPDKLKANVPMKRFARVEEQVGAMTWICSEDASFVTGLALPVDGGLTA